MMRLKVLATGLVLTMFAGASFAGDDERSVDFSSTNKIVLKSTVSGKSLEVILYGSKHHDGKGTARGPDDVRSPCTGSRIPCTVVDEVAIRVGGDSIFVPRSVFSDLSDVTKAKIMSNGDEVSLSLLGGDASESYIVKIIFDSSRVKNRMLSSQAEPGSPLQETKYYQQIVGE